MAKLKVYHKDGTDLYDLDDSKEIARGGEGFLLPVPKNNKIVAKIYHSGCVNLNEQKFSFLNKLDGRYFIKPLELLYDKKKTICGITMDFLPNDFYPLDSIFNKNFCLKNGINFSVKQQIAKQLIEAVTSAHKLQVNIGDLSGLNIMINNQGLVKFIDVDSYEVPGIKHTNKLLEEIRDYLHGGHVSTQSDFFSLSVVLFNYLTYLHPFKGVHKKVPKMSDRMIKKLPVFVQDPDLIIPKCYEPITDNFLQSQFEKIYVKGERFLLSIDKFVQPIIGKKVAPQNVNEAEVYMKTILSDTEIEYAYFNNTQGMIRTKEEYLIYDCSMMSNIALKKRLKRSEYLDVFIGDKNIVVVKNDSLYKFDKVADTFELMENLKINLSARFVHLESRLVMIEDESMYTINLDNIMHKNIWYDKSLIFGPSFTTHNGLIKNAGGVYYIHYNTGQNISISQTPIILKGTKQIKDIGIAQYVENQQTKFKWYNINNLKFTLFHETDSLTNFAYKGTDINDALIFEPGDNKIDVLRGIDFYKLAEIKCSLISTNTRLYNSNAGIIVINEDEATLINKR